MFEWLFGGMPTIDNEYVLKLISTESEFCSRCGGKLDLKHKGILPFCVNCRIEIIAQIKDERLKLFDKLEKNVTVRQTKKPSKTRKELVSKWQDGKKRKRVVFK